MESSKLPLWRRILIGLLLVVELASIVTLGCINNIIDYKLESVTDDVYKYVDDHLSLSALSEEEYNEFINNNRELIAKHEYSLFILIIYMITNYI